MYIQYLVNIFGYLINSPSLLWLISRVFKQRLFLSHTYIALPAHGPILLWLILKTCMNLCNLSTWHMRTSPLEPSLLKLKSKYLRFSWYNSISAMSTESPQSSSFLDKSRYWMEIVFGATYIDGTMYVTYCLRSA